MARAGLPGLQESALRSCWAQLAPWSSDLLSSTRGPAAAGATAVAVRLPHLTVAAALRSLPLVCAARQLISLRSVSTPSVRSSSDGRQHTAETMQLPRLPVAAAAQQLVSLRSFSGTADSRQGSALRSALHAGGSGSNGRGGGSRLTASTRTFLPAAAAQLACAARSFHSSSRRQVALGVVDKLHDEVAVVLPSDGRSRHFWEVLEFRPDGTVLETWKTPDVLGLHPRDVYLFASDVGIGQRAMLAARSGAILFRTDVCKAVVYHDRAVLFPCRRLTDTIRISQSMKAAVAQKSPLPFELKILEALLSETARAYANKSKRLAIVAETVLTDINTNFSSSAGELQRLIPIQRKLTEVQNDVQEVLEAIGDTVNDDMEVKKLCLTERQLRTSAASSAARAGEGPRVLPPALASSGGRTPEMRMGSAILESYEFKLQGTHTSLKEALDNIEQTRTVWHMQLDHQRNRVLRINLLISMVSLGGVMSTLPAAYFGMNLSSGLEEVPGVFWPVVQVSVIFGLASALTMWLYYKIGPKRRYKARLRDMRSLRDLLIYHLDDLDDVLEQVKQRAQKGAAVSRKEFQGIVKEAVRGKPMSKEEVELLYRVFDTNKDGFLELSEMVRIEEHIDDHFSSTHLI